MRSGVDMCPDFGASPSATKGFEQQVPVGGLVERRLFVNRIVHILGEGARL